MADNEHVKEVVRQFDKSICAKASKVEMSLMRTELIKDFVPMQKWSDIIAEFDEMEQRFSSEGDQL